MAEDITFWLLLCSAAFALAAAAYVSVTARRYHERELLLLGNYSYEITQAVEAATNGIAVMDLNIPGYPIVFANNALCEQVGRNLEDVIGKSLPAVLLEGTEDEARKAIAESMYQMQASDLEIKVIARPITRWFSLRLTPVKDKKDELSLFIAVFSEITALKTREAEFFEAQKMEALGRLAAGVAHDFNNVLSIIEGFSRVAVAEPEVSDAVKTYLERISAAAQRGAGLTKRMLTFSRHKIVDDTVIDLARTVKDQEVLLRPIIDASITLILRSSEKGLYVECSSDSVTQILLNLVINARDAMVQGGTLIVETRRCKSHALPLKLQQKTAGMKDFACLSISDSGKGMDKLLQARIFDPFFTTKGQGKGTGLGLSMVYGLIKQVGGHIEITSAPGLGTTMEVYLPASDRLPNNIIEGVPEHVADINLQGYTVMVAEDEPELLELVAGVLEKFGMKVLRASNGDEALAGQEGYQGPIDLLLTDVVMSGVDGVRLAQILQSLHPRMKTIFMSGYPASGQMARVELPREAYFMAKPLRYETLADLIAQTLSDTPRPKYDAPHWKSSTV